MPIFVVFLEAKMVNLGPIYFQISLPLKINGNDGQNKFEVINSSHIVRLPVLIVVCFCSKK